jgi:excisionase family DNA binding protein
MHRCGTSPNELYLKLSSVAVMLGLSRQRVHQLVKQGRLPTYEHFGHRFVHHTDVMAFKEKARPSDGSFRYL